MSTPTVMKLELSWASIARVLATLVGLWFLWMLQDIVVMLFLVFIFVAALSPIVSRWQKVMPRFVAVAIIYVIFFAILATFGSIFFTPLVDQVNTLARIFPSKLGSIVPLFEKISAGQNFSAQLTQALQQFSGSLTNLSSSLLSTTYGIFGGLFAGVVVLVLTFYLLLEEQAAKHFFESILPPHLKEGAFQLSKKITDKMGSWMRGQLLLMFIIGALDFIVLLVLKVPAPFALALWGALMEVVPFIGPILGAIPAVMIALATGSAAHALVVGVMLLLVIQQLEGHFIVPKVMEKAVGISPVNVILALMVGAKLYGMVGALLAVPIAAIIAVIVQDWTNIERAFRSQPDA